jgi:outer membrane lipoprotein SlyB
VVKTVFAGRKTNMNLRLYFLIVCLGVVPMCNADYERNKAVPVEKVLFGEVTTVRNVTEHELIQDKNQGWKVFGGALLGGAIGNQFGRGSGRDVATILGAMLGASAASDKHQEYREKVLHLVELMIVTEDGQQYMVLQDFDANMPFNVGDAIRMIYLSDGTVRVDTQQ